MTEPLKTMELTESEARIILERRADEAHREATKAFQMKALMITNRWVKWSKKNGSGLTMSTFQSSYEFNYLADDRRIMYEAVQTIMKTVRSLEIPREKPQC